MNQDGGIHNSGPSGVVSSQTPQPSSRPPPSFRACIACRQMKMKCEGVENPPCIRCSKVGRECIPQTSNRKVTRTPRAPPQKYERLPSEAIPKDESPLDALARAGSIASTSPISHRSIHTTNPHQNFSAAPLHHVEPSPREHNNHGGHAQSDLLTELPSIYSTPPIDAVTQSTPGHAGSGAASPHIMGSMSVRKRKRHPTSTPESQHLMTPAQSYSGDDGVSISRRDMRDFISLFHQRHVPYIPVLREEEFQDIDYIIDHEPKFAYAMCYVTARYLPGGKEIREALLPEVARIPKDVYTAKLGTCHDDDLCLLKALIVISSYADLTPPSQAVRPSGKDSLSYWSIKSTAEMYGFRLSLHRSIQELKAELHTNLSANIYDTKAYQRYTYWLWLFNSSHYCSLVSGTPPTMRVDLSIRAVPELLDQIGRHSRSTNLFGAVELFLIWEQVSSKHPQLGEWWCLPDPSERADESLTESLLNETDVAIDAWYKKWWDYINAEPHGAFLDYHGRFTRFCIASYAIKCLRISSQGVTPLQRSQIQRCVNCANHVLDFPLGRGPIQKDNLRYVDDAACIMISFCCIFILSACQSFSSIIPNISECLDNVTDAGHLMVELSINPDHKPHIQGTFILKRVETLRTALESSSLHAYPGTDLDEPTETRFPSPTSETARLMSEGFDQLFHEDGLFGIEPIWDFSMMLPGGA